MTQLEILRLKIGIASGDVTKDALLEIYLADALEYILTGTNTETIPDLLISAQVELALVYYNKQGIEGQTAHSEGGISRSFDDVPESIKKKIRSCRRLPARAEAYANPLTGDLVLDYET